MAKIIINPDRCKYCKMCVNVCPFHLIAAAQGLNRSGGRYMEQTDQEKCTGCRMCGMICPDGAISVYK